METPEDMKILFRFEYELKWRDLHRIRAALADKLSETAVPRQHADPLIIIISELVENAFKYSDTKLVTIILKEFFSPRRKMLIKIHHPVPTYHSDALKRLLVEVAHINGAQDVDRIYLDSLRESIHGNTKANTFRLALIRKTALGSLIHVQKSMLYKPGISIGVVYPLPG